MCPAEAIEASMMAALIEKNTLVYPVSTKVKQMLQNVVITRVVVTVLCGFREFGRISSLYVYERLFNMSGSSIGSVSSNVDLIWLWGKNYPT